MDGLLLFTGGMLSSSDVMFSADSTKLCSTQVNFISLDLMVEVVTLATLFWSICGGVLDFWIGIFLVRLAIALASERMASRRLILNV